VELLKQGQYVPLKNSEQIVSIFAGTSGVLDDIENAQVPSFVEGLVEHMNANHADVMIELDQWKTKWTDELEGTVKSACETFSGQFSA
jgi:F0F1-type ATP synthase alpha subunit